MLRVLVCLSAAALLAACGGDVEQIPASSGAGGAGGAASVTQSSSSAGTGDTSTSTGGASCATCSETVLKNSHDPLCPASQKVYDALLACVCDDACPMPCAEDCYFGGDPPVLPDCDACMQAAISGDGACAAAFHACAEDT